MVASVFLLVSCDLDSGVVEIRIFKDIIAFDIFSCQVRVNISSRYICVGPMVEPARLYDKCKRVFSIFPLFYLRSAIGWNL